jgi:predicted DNA binding CopG/RHH family protein
LTYSAVAAGPDNSYTHLQRKGVSQIVKKEASGLKRVNINVKVSLHNAFKATAAAQGTDMKTILLEFIRSYVAKH